jgi:hypothetical protein
MTVAAVVELDSCILATGIAGSRNGGYLLSLKIAVSGRMMDLLDLVG